jgi:hypothetical protein
MQNGNGNDWVQLDHNEKRALCLRSTQALGRTENMAQTYQEFLDVFYRRPNPETRARTIAETLAVCQVLIDNGTIDPGK